MCFLELAFLFATIVFLAEIIFAGNVINFWYHRILVLLEPIYFSRIQLDGGAGSFFFVNFDGEHRRGARQ